MSNRANDRMVQDTEREQGRLIFCAHADQNGEGAHWKLEGGPCPLDPEKFAGGATMREVPGLPPLEGVDPYRWCAFCGGVNDSAECLDLVVVVGGRDHQHRFDRMECLARWASVEAGLFITTAVDELTREQERLGLYADENQVIE